MDNNPYIPENNDKVAAFHACYWKLSGYQFLNGSINFTIVHDQIKKQLDRALEGGTKLENSTVSHHAATHYIEQCEDVRGKTHGYTVVKFVNCLRHVMKNVLEESAAKVKKEDSYEYYDYSNPYSYGIDPFLFWLALAM